MPSDPSSPPPGRHLLGPQVVGQRVVIRRVLPGERGPSGGPAMTDVLGVCTAWGDGVAGVRTDEGEQVAIAIADIVSGKPVPPRPSMRHRVSPVEAQVRALALWRHLELAELGAWTLRSSSTSTARRANSVLAMTPVGSVPNPVAGVVEHYRGLGRRPIAAVLPDSDEEGLFLDDGWVPESTDSPTLFQMASVAHVRRGRRPHGIEIWLTESGGSGEPGAAVARAVARAGAEAVGTAAYSRDWVGLRSLDVARESRRRGLGLAVVGALLEWGAEHGASTAYLQVLGQNSAALALYAGLGFRTHHAYRYLATPGGQSAACS